MTNRFTRRQALGAALALPFVRRLHAAAPSETVRHASFGASGMAWSDIGSLTASPNLKLVAVAEVDRSKLAEVTKKFPDVRVYADWRQLLDKEKDLDSVNVSTPDHMHAPIGLRCMERGLHVYSQKPLTQTIAEARRMTLAAAANPKLVTQMGIQIHSHEHHRTVVQLVQSGVVGAIKEVHSWSGKSWGEAKPLPTVADPIPAGLDWDLWLGVAEPVPYLKDAYHPFNWRKRLGFGTGTFGDMGCHLLDPVYGSLGLTAPTTLQSIGATPQYGSWGVGAQVRFEFPGTKYTTPTLSLTWYDGDRRPPESVTRQVPKKLSDQGSIYLGEKGVIYSPYIGKPVLLPADKFADMDIPKVPSQDHYRQYVEAIRGNGATTTPFAYAGPLTETVLLGCLSTHFPQVTLTWDAAKMRFADNAAATALVSKKYRKGWEV